IMSGMSITHSRRMRVAFCDPYMQVGQMALIRKRDVARFAAPERLYYGGARVGFQSNTTGEKFVRENLSVATPQGFSSIDVGVDALRDGQIDYFIHDAPTVWRLSTDPANTWLLGLYRPLTEEYLAWAVRKNDHALRERLNQSLARWKQDGRLGAVFGQWIKVSIEIK
ncbi:MAG: transporter substrate-binding domain-containing protein, partial [Pseudomonadota bacterium]